MQTITITTDAEYRSLVKSDTVEAVMLKPVEMLEADYTDCAHGISLLITEYDTMSNVDDVCRLMNVQFLVINTSKAVCDYIVQEVAPFNYSNRVSLVNGMQIIKFFN